MYIMYTPMPGRDAARKMAKDLVEKGLIACANIHRSDSIYPWEGELKEEEEWVVVGKTDRDVRDEIEKLHPYDCPCVLMIPVEANEAYETWVGKTTKSI